MELEAELSEHYWHNGRFWSQLVCTLTRERWETFAEGLFDGE